MNYVLESNIPVQIPTGSKIRMEVNAKTQESILT